MILAENPLLWLLMTLWNLLLLLSGAGVRYAV